MGWHLHIGLHQTFQMMVSFMLCSDKEVQSHGLYSTMNDEGKSRGEILNEIKANIGMWPHGHG